MHRMIMYTCTSNMVLYKLTVEDWPSRAVSTFTVVLNFSFVVGQTKMA